MKLEIQTLEKVLSYFFPHLQFESGEELVIRTGAKVDDDTGEITLLSEGELERISEECE